MACSRYQFFYGTGGVLSARYFTCGDNTPVDITYTGGVSGAAFLSAGLVAGAGNGIVIASSVITYTGYASAGGALVPGFVYPVQLKPWIQYTYAVSPTGAQFVQTPLTALEVPPTNP